MTYAVDFKDSGQDMLLGLINHENRATLTVPTADTWTKAANYFHTPAEYHVPDAIAIAPDADWFPAENVGFIVKKQINISSGILKVRAGVDNVGMLYVDGVKMQVLGITTSHPTYTFKVSKGFHTIAFSNHQGDASTSGGPSSISFHIYDNDTLVDGSNAGWGCVELGTDNGDHYAQREWSDLTAESVLLIQPPKALSDQSYQKSGNIAQSSVGDWSLKENHLERLWPHAVESVYAPIYADSYSKVIGPVADWDYASVLLVKKVIRFSSNYIKVVCGSDDYHAVYIDGVSAGGGNIGERKEYQIPITPGLHAIDLICDNTGGPGRIQFNVYDGSTLVDWSNEGWKCISMDDPLASKQISQLIYYIGIDEQSDLTVTRDDGGEVNLPTYVTEKQNDGDITKVTHYIDIMNTPVTWVTDVTKIITPKNTATVVRALDPIYGVKDVEVIYNRMDIEKLFSECGLAIPEINVDSDNGILELNQKVLDEINRRYGVNFELGNFTLQSDGKTYTIHAHADSLAFIGSNPLDIMFSLDTRIRNKELNGFLKDETIPDNG